MLVFPVKPGILLSSHSSNWVILQTKEVSLVKLLLCLGLDICIVAFLSYTFKRLDSPNVTLEGVTLQRLIWGGGVPGSNLGPEIGYLD
jgi:hypothetical protein